MESPPPETGHDEVRSSPRGFLPTMLVLGRAIVVAGPVMGSGELISTPMLEMADHREDAFGQRQGDAANGDRIPRSPDEPQGADRDRATARVLADDVVCLPASGLASKAAKQAPEREISAPRKLRAGMRPSRLRARP